MSAEYKRYLASREWALRREAVRARCGGVCERCQKNPMQAVHHLTYANIYNEPLEDLQGICDACHAYESGKAHDDPAERTYFEAMHALMSDSVRAMGCSLHYSSFHEGTIALWDGSTRDMRVVRVIDSLPSRICDKLLAIHARKGTVELLWSEFVWPGFEQDPNNGLGVEMDWWLITESFAIDLEKNWLPKLFPEIQELSEREIYKHYFGEEEMLRSFPPEDVPCLTK